MSCLDCETPTQVKSVAGEIQCEETREGEGACRGREAEKKSLSEVLESDRFLSRAQTGPVPSSTSFRKSRVSSGLCFS